jgi:hypothetical protein
MTRRNGLLLRRACRWRFEPKRRWKSVGRRSPSSYTSITCGRVRLSSDHSEIKIKADAPAPNFTPDWNKPPTEPILVAIRSLDCGRAPKMMKWGLIPPPLRNPGPQAIVARFCHNCHKQGAAGSFRCSTDSRPQCGGINPRRTACFCPLGSCFDAKSHNQSSTQVLHLYRVDQCSLFDRPKILPPVPSFGRLTAKTALWRDVGEVTRSCRDFANVCAHVIDTVPGKYLMTMTAAQ